MQAAREAAADSARLRLSMAWSKAGQRMTAGEESYVHEGLINTDPSHDCAHLLVAACRSLPWNPSKDRDGALIKLAEYNAVVVEHMIDKLFDGQCNAIPPSRVLPNLVEYIDWFVNVNFAPFPCSATEARRRFCAEVDVETVVRLAPHFFAMKREERRARREYRMKPIELSFFADDHPNADAETAEMQKLLRTHLHQLIVSTRS